MATAVFLQLRFRTVLQKQTGDDRYIEPLKVGIYKTVFMGMWPWFSSTGKRWSCMWSVYLKWRSCLIMSEGKSGAVLNDNVPSWSEKPAIKPGESYRSNREEWTKTLEVSSFSPHILSTAVLNWVWDSQAQNVGENYSPTKSTSKRFQMLFSRLTSMLVTVPLNGWKSL